MYVYSQHLKTSIQKCFLPKQGSKAIIMAESLVKLAASFLSGRAGVTAGACSSSMARGSGFGSFTRV